MRVRKSGCGAVSRFCKSIACFCRGLYFCAQWRRVRVNLVLSELRQLPRFRRSGPPSAPRATISAMKKPLFFAAVLLAFLLFPAASPCQSGTGAGTLKKTYSLGPGRLDQIRNTSWHTIEISSEYAIKVIAGPCRAKSTFQWICHLKTPWDLLVTDLRPETSNVNARANTITVTFSDTTANQDQPAAPSPDQQDQTDQPIPQGTPQADAPVQPPANRVKIRTYQLAVGHHLLLNNSRYTDFEIHSQGPIRVAIGDCYSEFTFSIECHGQIADINITDERSENSVGLNPVVITMREP